MPIVFNPFSGTFDFTGNASTGGDDNFSYIKVDSGDTVTVPAGQEMLFKNDLIVDGDLIIDGVIFQIPDPSDQCFFWTKITVDELIKVPVNRLMLYANTLVVEGNLLVFGDLMPV